MTGDVTTESHGAGIADPERLADNLRIGRPAVALVALRGEPEGMNVRASPCTPCRREVPSSQEVHQALGDRFRSLLERCVAPSDRRGPGPWSASRAPGRPGPTSNS